MYTGEDYWKNYMDGWFGKELIARWKEVVTLDSMVSNNKTIGLEIYKNDPAAPTIIFSHGIAGYARVLIPFLMPLYDRGYNVVAPDLQGYGYNDGLKGDFGWNAHVQNLVDTVSYAKKHFTGPIVLSGASMGGPLAYAASCLVKNEIDALICWCLWDFQDREFMLNETTTGKFTYALIPLLWLMSKLFGRMRIKTYALISYDTLTGSQEFNDFIKKDPQAGTLITVKGALSLILDSKAAIDHKDFTLPTLVMQPGHDRMTPKKYIKKTFENLGSGQKKYVELDNCEHFPVEKEFYEQWTEEADAFLKSVLQH